MKRIPLTILSIFYNKYFAMKQSSYEQTNRQLYELHLQRLKRKGQTMQDESLSKIIKVQEKKQESVNAPDDIFLNSIIYDRRQDADKCNNVTFAQFLHEEVRKSPSKVVSKNVEGIFITTFGYEPEVFLPIAKSKVPFFLVNREGEEKNGFVKKSYNSFENWTLISPPKENAGYGVFHTKLWLIKFSTFLRVVVCTSNHHLADWTLWQNAFWYHDCPLITSEQNGQKKEEGQKVSEERAALKDFDYEKDFFETLNWVIAEMLPKGYDLFGEMKLNLKDYSFKGIQVVLIPSLPGRFKGEFLSKVGIGKVKKIMSKCSLQMQKPVMTYNCTSLGKPDEKFVRQLYFAFSPTTFQFYPERFKLVFPTEKYINQETCGEAQVLFLTKENYDKCELKNHIFHRYEESPANGVLGGIPHLKTVIVEEGQKQQDRCIVYVGSHNFTRAAWGNYEKNESQLSLSNSELGLLFLNYSKEKLLNWLPYKYPPMKYGNGERPFLRPM